MDIASIGSSCLARLRTPACACAPRCAKTRCGSMDCYMLAVPSERVHPVSVPKNPLTSHVPVQVTVLHLSLDTDGATSLGLFLTQHRPQIGLILVSPSSVPLEKETQSPKIPPAPLVEFKHLQK
eukprot:scaffold36141_cov16-Tisochrysis_lutea.AAC.5